jgi:hypothetical protein
MADRTLADVATAVLQDTAPDQLRDFHVVMRGFDASPEAHERAQRGVREESAAGAALAGEVIGGIILAVGADLAKDLLKDAVVAGAKRVRRTVLGFARRRRVTSGTVLPGLPASWAEEFRMRAAALSVEYGASAEEAKEMADSFVRQWPSAL